MDGKYASQIRVASSCLGCGRAVLIGYLQEEMKSLCVCFS